MDQATHADEAANHAEDQIHMKINVTLSAGVAGFAEDKDYAKQLRRDQILPALAANNDVVVDFSAVRYATQSFVHALIGEAIQKYGEPVLEHLEFRHCTPQLRSVIELVVDYSVGGFAATDKRAG
jgi:hypothetical protein